MPTELILGANGFLGQHLASARRGHDCVLHSRSPANRICRDTGLPFRAGRPGRFAASGAARLEPETVYLLARPETQDAGVLLDFAQNVQWLLQEWADRRSLRRVVFASTQLVYATPPDDTPLPIASPLGPETPYDCHKAEMEFYLSLLAHHPCGVKVEILRLPLLAGLAPTPKQAQEQYLYQWRSDYQAGRRWSFPPDDPRHKTWGNSWVHTADVVNLMTTPFDGAARFRIVQPVSGHLSYLALDAFFRAQYALPPQVASLHLPKTSFYLQDNANTRERPIADAFPEHLEIA